MKWVSRKIDVIDFTMQVKPLIASIKARGASINSSRNRVKTKTLEISMCKPCIYMTIHQPNKS